MAQQKGENKNVRKTNPVERRDIVMAERDDVAILTESMKDLVTAIIDGKLDTGWPLE